MKHVFMCIVLVGLAVMAASERAQYEEDLQSQAFDSFDELAQTSEDRALYGDRWLHKERHGTGHRDGDKQYRRAAKEFRGGLKLAKLHDKTSKIIPFLKRAWKNWTKAAIRYRRVKPWCKRVKKCITKACKKSEVLEETKLSMLAPKVQTMITKIEKARAHARNVRLGMALAAAPCGKKVCTHVQVCRKGSPKEIMQKQAKIGQGKISKIHDRSWSNKIQSSPAERARKKMLAGHAKTAERLAKTAAAASKAKVAAQEKKFKAARKLHPRLEKFKKARARMLSQKRRRKESRAKLKVYKARRQERYSKYKKREKAAKFVVKEKRSKYAAWQKKEKTYKTKAIEASNKKRKEKSKKYQARVQRYEKRVKARAAAERSAKTVRQEVNTKLKHARKHKIMERKSKKKMAEKRAKALSLAMNRKEGRMKSRMERHRKFKAAIRRMSILRKKRRKAKLKKLKELRTKRRVRVMKRLRAKNYCTVSAYDHKYFRGKLLARWRMCSSKQRFAMPRAGRRRGYMASSFKVEGRGCRQVQLWDEDRCRENYKDNTNIWSSAPFVKWDLNDDICGVTIWGNKNGWCRRL